MSYTHTKDQLKQLFATVTIAVKCVPLNRNSHECEYESELPTSTAVIKSLVESLFSNVIMV